MGFEEASYKLHSAPESDIARYLEGETMSERIREWLDTPEGTIAHNPSWGHNLRPFKHDLLSRGNGIDTLIEMALTRKMPLDIEDLRIVSVKVEVEGVDLLRLTSHTSLARKICRFACREGLP